MLISMRQENTSKFVISTILFAQIAVIANLIIAPQFPIVAAGIIGALLLAATIRYLRAMQILVIVAIIVSEALYIETGGPVIRAIDFVLLHLVTITAIRWLLNPEDAIESMPGFGFSFALLIGAALLSLLGTISVKGTIVEFVQLAELIVASILFFNLIKSRADIKFIFLVILAYAVFDSFYIISKNFAGTLVGRHVGLWGTVAFELSFGMALSLSFFFMTDRFWQKIVFILTGFLITYAILLTQGRALLLAGLVMTMVCNFLFSLQKKKISLFFILTSLTILMVVVAYIAQGSVIQSRYASIVEGGNLRDLRLIVWAASIMAWQSSPIWGIGFGNTGLAISMFSPKPFGIAMLALEGVKTAHNEYLNFILQAGIFGGIAIVLFYFILWKKALRLYRSSTGRDKEIMTIVFGFICGVIVFGISNDLILAGNGMIVMLLIALVARLAQLKSEESLSPMNG